ncbi:hypothetical protein ACVWZW_005173 [Bradyrhizobium sp. F1.13.4]
MDYLKFLRGDGHYARPEAMIWCENNGIDYIFGLSGTKPLARKVDEVADDIRTRRAIENLPVLRGYTETRHKAKSWDRERRTVARLEATMLGLDIRFVVTRLDAGSAEWIYDSLYCARGQAENLIKKSCIRRSLPLIAPVAVRRSPTRSVSSSIPPLIG